MSAFKPATGETVVSLHSANGGGVNIILGAVYAVLVTGKDLSLARIELDRWLERGDSLELAALRLAHFFSHV